MSKWVPRSKSNIVWLCSPNHARLWRNGQWQARGRLSLVRQHSSQVSASELRFGQALHETHPHLLKPGELTPGITALEYAQRRDALAEALPENAIAILASANVKYKSGAVFHEFRQDSNFFYLTGFNEPESFAVIAKSSMPGQHYFALYVREKDSKTEQWDGSRSGTQAAMDVFNADVSGNSNDICTLLQPMIDDTKIVYTDVQQHGLPSRTKSPIARLFSLFSASSSSSSSVSSADDSRRSSTSTASNLFNRVNIKPLSPIVNRLRNIKSPAEITLLREVGRQSGRAITQAMQQSWQSEHHLAAFLDYRFRTSGLDGSAYIPVVAAGTNASIIHYTANNALIRPTESILVDAGGEKGNYIADITRTFPASARPFSPAEKDLYSAVLDVQRYCISQCRGDEKSKSLDELHNEAEVRLIGNLEQIGFKFPKSVLGGTIKPSQRQRDVLKRLLPHHLGHYIGLDVHDTPGQSRATKLQTGQCITIEPGIYVPNDNDVKDDDYFPRAFRGMGIRIEDSIAIDHQGPIVLTAEAVKEIDDIEALRS